MKKLIIICSLVVVSLSVSALSFKDVHFSEQKNEFRITVDFDGTPVYTHRVFRDPFRITVDITNAQIAERKTVDMNQPPFKQLRIAQFEATTVRCVLEMLEERPFKVQQSGSSIVIIVDYPNETTVNVIPRMLPVNISPRDDSQPLAEIKVGEKIKVLNAKNNWLLILLADGKDGWIKSDYVKINK